MAILPGDGKLARLAIRSDAGWFILAHQNNNLLCYKIPNLSFTRAFLLIIIAKVTILLPDCQN